MAAADVVVVGSYVQDLAFHCEAIPRTGETTIGRFSAGPGGKGSNQAVAAARAGASTRFIGAIGRDYFGSRAAAFHRTERIDSRLPVKSQPTAVAGITVDRLGRNQIVVAMGASARLSARDVPARALAGAKVVVCQHEASLAVNAHAFRLARRLGATTVLNPAPVRPHFDPRVLRQVDVLIPNEGEFIALASQLGGSLALGNTSDSSGPGRSKSDSSIDASLRSLAAIEFHALCRSFAVPVVIVTMADHGCFVSLPDRCEHLPAHRVKVVDTTGAGDAFVGAFSAGLVRFSGDIPAAARFANAAAALSVTRFGTASSMPRVSEILALMEELGGTAVSAPRRGAREQLGDGVAGLLSRVKEQASTPKATTRPRPGVASSGRVSREVGSRSYDPRVTLRSDARRS